MVHKKGLEFGKDSFQVALDEMEDMEKLIKECRSDVPIFSAAIGRHLETTFYEQLTGEFRDRCSCSKRKI